MKVHKKHKVMKKLAQNNKKDYANSQREGT
jgi:hypothetical protein